MFINVLWFCEAEKVRSVSAQLALLLGITLQRLVMKPFDRRTRTFHIKLRVESLFPEAKAASIAPVTPQLRGRAEAATNKEE